MVCSIILGVGVPAPRHERRRQDSQAAVCIKLLVNDYYKVLLVSNYYQHMLKLLQKH